MVGEIIISEAVKTTVSEVIDRIIAPKIKQFSERIGLTYEKLLIPKGEHFAEYLNRSYKKHSIVNTLVLRNRQMLLKDIYQPLTLVINRNGPKEQTIPMMRTPSIRLFVMQERFLQVNTRCRRGWKR